MTKTAKIITAIVIIIIIAGGLWLFMDQEQPVKTPDILNPAASKLETTSVRSTPPNSSETENNRQPADSDIVIPAENPNTTIDEDVSAVDEQINNLESDNTSAETELNVKTAE